LYLYDDEADCFRPVIRDLNAFSYPYSVMDGNLLWIVAAGGQVLNCYDTDDFSLVASYPTPHLIYHIVDAGNGEYWMSGMGQLSIFDVRNRTWKELPAAVRNEAGLMQGDIDILYPVDASTILLNVIGKGMYCYNRGPEGFCSRTMPDSPSTCRIRRSAPSSRTAARTSGSGRPTTDIRFHTTIRTSHSTSPDLGL
jgi:hypothetical protein